MTRLAFSPLVAATVCLLSLGAQAIKITEFEVPSKVHAGEDLHLKCGYTLEPFESEAGVIVKWWWRPDGGSPDSTSQLYQRLGHNKPILIPNRHFHDIIIKGTDDLFINDATPAESGEFQCEVFISNEDRRSQRTVVYTEGSGPRLNLTLVEDGEDADEEDDALVMCVALGVSPKPSLGITVNDKVLPTTNKAELESDGTFNVVSAARVSQDLVNKAKVVCELFYEDDSFSHPPYTDGFEFEVSPASVSRPMTSLLLPLLFIIYYWV